ncbi:MAG: PilZ domain-containing protein [Thermodesulfobacteriota bacterium]
MSENALLSYPEKRGARRALTPTGTTVILKIDDVLEINLIRDISSSGMLICNFYKGEQHEIDSPLSDIIINILPSEPSTGKKHHFTIEKGRIVRSFFDENSQNHFYGVEFIYESPYIREKIDCYVDEVLKS